MAVGVIWPGMPGLIEAISYFAYGLAESARRIMGVVPASRGFDRVARIEDSSDAIDLISHSGFRVHAALGLSFLRTGEIAR